MKTPAAAIALIALGILFFGCTQQQPQVQFVCPDGSTVSDKALCATATAQPTATPAQATAAPTGAAATPGPTAAPVGTPSPERLGCFSDPDCSFSGSICSSRLYPQASDGKAPCENCVCNCVAQKCTQAIRVTPTPAPSPTPVPEKIGITFVQAVNVKYNYAEIQWHTALNTTSHVRYGTAPGVFNKFYDDKIRAIDHWVALGQLGLNKTHYFEVKSCILNENGTEAPCETAPLSSFTTPPWS
ncbi:MAG: hypothetical protein WC792_03725 [Candidatus Micrarchaeia archaeon]|jgi:hypothetical protein